MKLERPQLDQARQACKEEERQLASAVSRMEDCLQDIRSSAEFIRRDGQMRLAQAKTGMATQEIRYREAMLKLQRLEVNGARAQPSGGRKGKTGAGGKANNADAPDPTEEQRQLVDEYAQEVTRVCEHFTKTESETQATEERLRQLVKEAEEAVSAARRRHEEALRVLKQLGRVFDDAEKLLRDYERGGDD